MTILERIGFVRYVPDEPSPDHSEEDALVDAATQKALSSHRDARRAIRDTSSTVAALLDGALQPPRHV